MRHSYLKNYVKKLMKKRKRGVWKVGKQIKGFVVVLLQQSGLPSLASSCNGMKVLFFKIVFVFFGALVLFCFVFFFKNFLRGRLLRLLLPRGFGCSLFFCEWFPLCIPYWFKIPLVVIILAFTL